LGSGLYFRIRRIPRLSIRATMNCGTWSSEVIHEHQVELRLSYSKIKASYLGEAS